MPTRPYCGEGRHGRKSLPEQVLSSPQVGVMGVGVVPPETDAPHLIKSAGFS